MSASISGWNINSKQLPLDTNSSDESFYSTQLKQGQRLSNPVKYAIDALPDCQEKEQNDTIKDAQEITIGQIVNGRIDKPQDCDVFSFTGRSGQKIVAEVDARKINSPLDSLLRLTDKSGNTLAWNDDYVGKNIGLLTHNADSYFQATLPKDGTYFVQITDTDGHGGESFGYRLRLSEPMPDFELYVSPSSINLSPQDTVVLNVQAIRKDGFDGEIEIVLEDAPSDFSISGGNKIVTGRDNIKLTLTTALPKALGQPVALKLQGRAVINGSLTARNAIPAEDMMQAFFYRHLVPSEQLLAAIVNSRQRRLFFERVGPDVVEIPVGGNIFVWVRLPRNPFIQIVQLELSEPPAGISIRDINLQPGEFTFKIAADANTIKPGYCDNLIIGAYNEVTTPVRGDPNKTQKVRNFAGLLPAIPIQIIKN